MTTLHAHAATKPLTYITPTPDTVTPPEALYSLYDGYFQYFARKGFVEPANAEQVRPVLDLLPAPHPHGNEYPTQLPGGNTPVTLLTEIPGIPPIATLATRYKYTQAVFVNNLNDIKWHLEKNIPGSQVNIGNRTKYSAIFSIACAGERYLVTLEAMPHGHSVITERVHINAHPDYGYEPDVEHITDTLNRISSLLKEFIKTH